jgi:hypothetical protein
MKHILKTMLLATLFSQGAFATSCDLDKIQMYDQISKYRSISTTGCPVNTQGWGINQALNVIETSSTTCSATCVYVIGPGSQGTQCNWEKGNWGSTLTCS